MDKRVEEIRQRMDDFRQNGSGSEPFRWLRTFKEDCEYLLSLVASPAASEQESLCPDCGSDTKSDKFCAAHSQSFSWCKVDEEEGCRECSNAWHTSPIPPSEVGMLNEIIRFHSAPFAQDEVFGVVRIQHEHIEWLLEQLGKRIYWTAV
jgi:hypothetical protein